MTTLPAISDSQPRNSFFVTTGTLESRRNKLFRHVEPLSLPTTTQAGETSRFAAYIHPRLRRLPRDPHHTPYCRNFDCTISRRHLLQPRLPLMGLREFVSSSARIRWEIRVGGGLGGARKPSFTRNACRNVKQNATAIGCL